MGDKTMSMGIDLIHVLGSDEYVKLCQTQGVNRAYDVKDAIVMKWHKKHCAMTVERAQNIVALVSKFNKDNLNKQIHCSYVVECGDVRMTVNSVQYGIGDFADICYHIRRLGVKVPLIFNELGKGE